jgi:hypothetical protein
MEMPKKSLSLIGEAKSFPRLEPYDADEVVHHPRYETLHVNILVKV